MFNKQWNVLVIDDEPDVHAVTKLALKRMSVFNLPIHLWECSSKREAVEFFQKNPEAKSIALAIVDVVMENDQAGLEFCEFLRRDMKNTLTRLVVRTGQAGKAPEREVVDKYDITGYLAKTDATQDKIYSTVKCCIKEYYSSFMLSRSGILLAVMANGIESREMFRKTLHKIINGFSTDAQGRRVESIQPNYSATFGEECDHVGAGTFEDRDFALKMRERLLKLPGEPIGADGDYFVYEDGNLMIVLASRLNGKMPIFTAIFNPTAWPMPDFAIAALHAQFSAMRPFWMLAPP